jgi:predicted aspartyl protease
MRLLSTLVVFVMLFVPCLVSAGTRITPFTLRSPGDIVVPVAIDGQGPFRMLLDTGASRSAVTPAVADRLAGRIVGETRMVTPAGDGQRSLVLLKGVVVGAIGPQSVVGLRLEPGDLGDPDIDGLIGLDLLARAPFTIDYAAGTLAWRLPSDPDPPGTRVPVELVGGRLTAAVSAPGGDLRFLVDTGADRLVVRGRALARLPAVRLNAVGSLRTVTGIRGVFAAQIDRLVLGDAWLSDVVAAVVPDDGTHPSLEDGLLPLHLFERVTIDVPARALILHDLPPSRGR